MSPVKEKWNADYALQLDDTEIRSIEQWDGDQSIDTLVHHRRGMAGLWTALAVLAIALVVAVAYGYSVISQQNTELRWLSGRTSSLGAVRDRAERFETLFNKWNVRQAMLAAHVQEMDTAWRSGLDDVRLRAEGLVANARQSGNNDLNQRAGALNAEIAQISSRQQAQLALIAQLEKQLASTQEELASAKAGYGHELAALHLQQTSSQQEIDSLNTVLSTDQISFEAEKNHDEQIGQGVALHLTGTDLAHQSFRGWIRIAGSRRTIWVRNHPAELPVVFYLKPGGEAYELVVTKVNSGAVSGYLLVPSSTSTGRQDVASNSKPITTSGQGSF
jgi:hypothetical protein